MILLCAQHAARAFQIGMSRSAKKGDDLLAPNLNRLPLKVKPIHKKVKERNGGGTGSYAEAKAAAAVEVQAVLTGLPGSKKKGTAIHSASLKRLKKGQSTRNGRYDMM